ncbi:LLM class flavin-dependent oxidoreductase [Acidobacteria bacterium AH-259-D05]|nr:LLM class flavin-dependent oxidoreductase [Acidobacteria bacterium AH-259-D05]
MNGRLQSVVFAEVEVLTVKFGLALDFWSTSKPLDTLLDDYVSLLKLAEQYGFDSVWAGEHRPRSAEPGHVPSPLLVLSALARSTQLRLGTGITLLTIWHPLRLAYDAAILDQISGGRFTLGVGVGNPEVMKRYGVAPDEAASRMDEALILLKKLWAGEEEFQGRHFKVKGKVYPQPIQPGGPPIWVGGKIRHSVQRAAELGDGWYGATQYHFEVIRRQARRYRELLSAKGQDPSSATVVINRTTFVAETDERARTEGKPYVGQVLNFYGQMGLIQDGQGNPLDPQTDLFEATGDEMYFAGSPETCLESIRKYHEEAGVTQFNLRISMGNMPLELVQRTVTLLGEHVLPNFKL